MQDPNLGFYFVMAGKIRGNPKEAPLYYHDPVYLLNFDIFSLTALWETVEMGSL